MLNVLRLSVEVLAEILTAEVLAEIFTTEVLEVEMSLVVYCLGFSVS